MLIIRSRELSLKYKKLVVVAGLICANASLMLASAQSIRVDIKKYDETIQTFLTDPSSANTSINNASSEFIVAHVANDIITNQELKKRFEQIQKQLKITTLSVSDKQELIKQAFDDLVLEKLQIHAAQETGYTVDTKSIDAAVALIAQQNNISPAELLKQVQKDGLSINDFRQRLRTQLYLQKAKERFVDSKARVTDFDIETRLGQYQGLISPTSIGVDRKLELNIAQLLIPVPENASPEQQKEALVLAEKVLKQAQNGNSFVAIRNEFQLKSTEADAKGMGYRDPDKYPTLFVDAVQNLKTGQVTQLVQSGAGWHVLKLVDKRSQLSNLVWVPETRARHILLRSVEGVSKQGQIAQLTALRQQIQNGNKTFESVASSVSEDGSAANGGDLGWAGPAQFVPEFEKVMNQLTIGEISPPIVSRFGVHLIQVLDRKANMVEKSPVRDRIRALLREEKVEQLQKDWLKEIKERAFIELKEMPRF